MSPRRCIAALVLLLAASPAYAIIGMPFTPLSFAGAARRTVRRTAFVGAAAVGTAAVVGTAAAVRALPPGCAVGYPCGPVVYQPVYQGTTVVYVPQ